LNLKPKTHAGAKFKIVNRFLGCSRWVERERQHITAVADHRVAAVETRDYSPRRIEFKNTSEIEREIGSSLKMKDWERERLACIEAVKRECLAETDNTRSSFPEEAKLLEPFA
jgi:hypothetical protein